MTTSGNANYGMQARQAAEQGAGGLSRRPSGNDKQTVLVTLIGIAAIAVALVIFT